MNTMTRCKPPTSRPHSTARAAALLLALGAAAPAFMALPAAAQQVQPGMGGVRNFPEAAQRGTLVILSTAEAQLNGSTVRTAPGLRIFSPQNTLVMAHSVIGQSFTVNYTIEPATGLLHTVWILTKAEAAVPRKGSGGGSFLDSLFGSGS
ncbi:hypothetical protein [Paracidovorax cattleyae]|uniref:hypothetical protein n=1 Tax=Paracidovorax cattleyae TaxID=80868 RepID=UPI0018AF9095|nr:hypothetical protein [Paracidovorax cattleyae]MBF9265642.1 hypothetical protein [Paracidovorax cattleyae]